MRSVSLCVSADKVIGEMKPPATILIAPTQSISPKNTFG